MDDTHQDWGDEESSDAKRFRVRRGSTSNRTAGGGGGGGVPLDPAPAV